jgi:hypothetical protein
MPDPPRHSRRRRDIASAFQQRCERILAARRTFGGRDLCAPWTFTNVTAGN